MAQQVARAFRAETGSTPAAFVAELRLEAARRLLESSELTVTAIARVVGYRHGETLHRAFVRRLATTPEAYRRQYAEAGLGTVAAEPAVSADRESASSPP
nr:helix-turn-helix transcriptional regulator [Nocardia cerradoensis]